MEDMQPISNLEPPMEVEEEQEQRRRSYTKPAAILAVTALVTAACTSRGNQAPSADIQAEVTVTESATNGVQPDAERQATTSEPNTPSAVRLPSSQPSEHLSAGAPSGSESVPPAQPWPSAIHIGPTPPSDRGSHAARQRLHHKSIRIAPRINSNQIARHPRPGVGNVLPVPDNARGTIVIPRGNYVMPNHPIKVTGTETIDLRAATVTGNDGALFGLENGGNLTIKGGAVNGTMAALIMDNVRPGGSGSVDIEGTHTNKVRSLVLAKSKDVGPIDAKLNNVRSTKLFDGLKIIGNRVQVLRSVLLGGGEKLSGNSAGIHIEDDRAGNVGVKESQVTVTDSTIANFVAKNNRGGYKESDAIVAETRVGLLTVLRNKLSGVSDALVDSKAKVAVVANNIMHSTGYRAIASHWGTLTAKANTIFQAAKTADGKRGKVFDATGVLKVIGGKVNALGAWLGFASSKNHGSSTNLHTYPRDGHITGSGVTDSQGHSLTGPNHQEAGTSVKFVP